MSSTVQVTAKVDLTDSAMQIAGNFLKLYEDPWFIVAIIMAFVAGQIVHAVLRGYWSHMRDLTKALYIWLAHAVVGGSATLFLVDSADEYKLALFAPVNSIVFYYLLLWVAVKWYPMPRFARFLTLRETTIGKDGEVDFGQTIQFLRPKK